MNKPRSLLTQNWVEVRSRLLPAWRPRPAPGGATASRSVWKSSAASGPSPLHLPLPRYRRRRRRRYGHCCYCDQPLSPIEHPAWCHYQIPSACGFLQLQHQRLALASSPCTQAHTFSGQCESKGRARFRCAFGYAACVGVPSPLGMLREQLVQRLLPLDAPRCRCVLVRCCGVLGQCSSTVIRRHRCYLHRSR